MAQKKQSNFSKISINQGSNEGKAEAEFNKELFRTSTPEDLSEMLLASARLLHADWMTEKLSARWNPERLRNMVPFTL